jgi:diguanylate cyclase (GGDEF)-like protein/PAS domain S-box-containing protein
MFMIKFELAHLSECSTLFCAVDFKGRLQQSNPAWQRLSISSEQLLTTTYWDWIHPDDVAVSKNALSRLGNGEEQVNFESRWRDAKGQYHPIHWTATISVTNQLIYLMGLETFAKHQSLSYYQTMLENLQEGIILWDIDGRIRACNAQAVQILGITEDELIGQTSWTLVTIQEDGSAFPPEAYPHQIALTTKTIGVPVIMGVYRSDNTLIWLNISAHPLKSTDQQLSAVMSTFTDISEYKYRQKTLSEKVTFLSSIFQNVNVGVAVTNETGLFLHVNPTYCHLYDYRVEELIGQPFTILVPSTMRTEAMQYHTAFLTNQAENGGSWTMQHRSGHTRQQQIKEDKVITPDGRPFKITFVTETTTPPSPNAQTVTSEWIQVLLNLLPVTVISLDRSGYLTFAHGRHLGILGLTEWVGQSILSAHQQLGTVTEDLRRALEGETFSKMIVHAGIDFEIQYVPLLSENEWTGTLVVFSDITEHKILKTRLKEVARELKLLIPHTSVGLLSVENEEIVEINQKGAYLLGYNQAELKKKSVIDIFRSAEEYHTLQQQALPYIKEAKTFRSSQWLRKKPGSFIYCQLTIETFTHSSKALWLVETSQVQTVEGGDLKSILWHTVAEVLLITDNTLTIEMANPYTQNFTGYSPDELVKRSLQDLDSGQQPEQFYEQLLETMIQQGQWQGQIWQRHKNGSAYCCTMTLTAYTAEKDGTNRFLVVLSHKQTVKATLFDPLLELPTRALFRYSLTKTYALAHRHHTRFALLLISVDDIETIRTQFGHTISDQLLYKIGQSLKTTVRESDTVSRYSDHTFAISLDEIAQPSDAGMVGQMILFKSTQPFSLKSYQVQCSVSIGITVYPEDGQQTDTLLKLAYSAMERAQRLGGNQCCFYNPQLAET